MMINRIAVATIAFLLSVSPIAYAAEPSNPGSNAGMGSADLSRLTDARVALIKAALQMTPDQEKLWPAVEEAMRARIQNRRARWEQLAKLRDSSPLGAMQERNALQLLRMRADSLSQRGADLKKVVDAWDPLYKTLSEDQKSRMAFVVVVTARGLRDSIEHNFDPEDYDE